MKINKYTDFLIMINVIEIVPINCRNRQKSFAFSYFLPIIPNRLCFRLTDLPVMMTLPPNQKCLDAQPCTQPPGTLQTFPLLALPTFTNDCSKYINFEVLFLLRCSRRTFFHKWNLLSLWSYIVIKLPRTYQKLHCKGEPYQSINWATNGRHSITYV